MQTVAVTRRRLDPIRLVTLLVTLPNIVVGVIVAVQYEIRTDLSASSWQAMLNIGLLILCLILLKVRGKVALVLALGAFAYYLFQYILPYVRG